MTQATSRRIELDGDAAEATFGGTFESVTELGSWVRVAMLGLFAPDALCEVVNQPPPLCGHCAALAAQHGCQTPSIP